MVRANVVALHWSGQVLWVSDVFCCESLTVSSSTDEEPK